MLKNMVALSILACSYAFSIALFSFVVLERVMNACATLIARLVWGRQLTSSAVGGRGESQGCELLVIALRHLKSVAEDEGDYSGAAYTDEERFFIDLYSNPVYHATSDIKGYASMQLVGAGFTLFSTIVSAIINFTISALSGLTVYFVWALAATAIFSLLYMLQESYSHILVEAVDQYNSSYGPILHEIVFVPLQVYAFPSTCVLFPVSFAHAFLHAFSAIHLCKFHHDFCMLSWMLLIFFSVPLCVRVRACVRVRVCVCVCACICS